MSDAPAMIQEERYQATRKVTLIGAIVNVLLATVQVLGGMLAQSQALIADGMHTLSDLASDVVVLVASREAHKQADEQHPYGHGRIETLATTVLGAVLIGVAVVIIMDTADRFFGRGELMQPGPLALVFACVAVFAKEGLYRYTIRVAKQFNSSLLRANAAHHRSDAISSLFVIVGVGLNLMGVPYADAIAAVLVAIMIGHMGWELVWQSGQELIDAALDEDVVSRIHQEILKVDGVVSLHQLRTRQSGSDAFADVHIQVPSYISVSEGHHIADAVRNRLVECFDQMTDVTVHTDPEDDDIAAPSRYLPLRQETLKMLDAEWHDVPAAQRVERIALHYLDGMIEVDAFIDPDGPLLSSEEVEKLKAACRSVKSIREVRIYTSN